MPVPLIVEDAEAPTAIELALASALRKALSMASAVPAVTVPVFAKILMPAETELFDTFAWLQVPAALQEIDSVPEFFCKSCVTPPGTEVLRSFTTPSLARANEPSLALAVAVNCPGPLEACACAKTPSWAGPIEPLAEAFAAAFLVVLVEATLVSAPDAIVREILPIPAAAPAAAVAVELVLAVPWFWPFSLA